MQNTKWKIILIFFLVNFLNALNLPSNFQADFIQTIQSNGKKLIYKGKIYYHKNKIFWHYTYPVEKYIWINDKVYVYEPDLIQVTISKKPKFNLQNIINNAKKIKQNEYEAVINNKKAYFIFDKIPKKLWYKDKMGNLVSIVFNQISLKKINPSIFIPKYPKNVDIIYQR